MEQGGEVDPSIVPQPQRIVTSRSTFTCHNFQYERLTLLTGEEMMASYPVASTGQAQVYIR